MLGLNRAALRIAWLKQNFGSWNLHIDRHPFDMWSSYEAQKAKGNSVFFVFWLITIERNATHAVFAPLADRVPLRSSVQKLFSTRNWFYRNAVVDLPADTTYFMVFYLWITFALHALSL